MCNQPATALDAAAARLIEFEPGYRQAFWHRNCVAIGLSAGFIEPLEASALVLVELSARRLAERLPLAQGQMQATASEFNREFTDRWEQIIEFLKLHYVLSGRDDSDYWIDHRSAASIPAGLQQKLLPQLHMTQERKVGITMATDHANPQLPRHHAGTEVRRAESQVTATGSG